MLNSLWGRVLEIDMEGGYERNIVISLRSTKIRKHQDGYGVLVGETRGNTFAKTPFSPNSMLLKTNKIELMYLLFLCLILLERQLIMGTKNEGKDKTFLGVGVLLSTNAEY